ncbi:MAG: exodeoxyribonuclease VII large subunit [Alphaproteobacteria bacterium]|nr:exodeoxyribonuclease VII large subunit [Alphaproteobacteria bacterium]
MTEQPVLSVTELSLSLKSCVEQVFNHIKVRGEVSDIKRATSGHIYFSLKDKDSVLAAICWKGSNRQCAQHIQEGLEIICTGKLSTYPGRSNYQMIVEAAEPAGEGALLKLLKDRKEKLEKEGLFDPAHKKPIPFLPEVIGVVTSPTGAVIRDIIHRVSDRFPRHIIVWPVAVQGEECAEQVAAAVRGFNALPENGKIPKPDILIVARGGGSLEDLWGFNEECVVRAVYDSEIPVISAVGHETDTTLIDFVSDLRAPTPTGAAEKAVPVRLEIYNILNTKENNLKSALNQTLIESRLKIQQLTGRFPNLNEIIQGFIQKTDDRTERLQLAIKTYLSRWSEQTKNISRLLQSYSYQAVLKRGFTIISNGKKVITNAFEAQKQTRLNIQFSDGIVDTIPLKNNKRKQTIQATDQPDLWSYISTK